MNKRSLELLGKAFEAEVTHAPEGTPRLMQTRATKLAESLVAEGYLEVREQVLGGRFPIHLKGYGLTLLGNLTYCISVDDSLVPPEGYDA